MKIQKDEIIKLEHQLIDGISSGNISFLENILNDDLLFIAPNGQTITKEIDLTSHRRHEMTVEKIILTIEEIRIHGSTAIAVIVYDTKGVMLGNPIEGKFRYLRIWKRYDDGFKVIAGSCTKL